MANNMHISYDLHAPEKNYERVIAKVKQLGSWAKIHKSFWYVDTPLSAEQVATAVWSAMDHDDSLYVVDSTNNIAYWFNIHPESSKYIMDHWPAAVA